MSDDLIAVPRGFDVSAGLSLARAYLVGKPPRVALLHPVLDTHRMLPAAGHVMEGHFGPYPDFIEIYAWDAMVHCHHRIFERPHRYYEIPAGELFSVRVVVEE